MAGKIVRPGDIVWLNNHRYCVASTKEYKQRNQGIGIMYDIPYRLGAPVVVSERSQRFETDDGYLVAGYEDPEDKGKTDA